jgi:hypothetical protein
MFSISPSGEMSVSNSTRCSRPSWEIVTSAAKPCSARRVSSVWPPSITGEGTRGARESIGARIAGPSSSNRMSVTLSTSVVIVSDSTGSRPIVSNSVTTGTFLSRSTLREQPRTRDPRVRGAEYVGTPPEATDHRPAPPLTHSVRSRRAGPGGDVAARLLLSVFFGQYARDRGLAGYVTPGAACRQPLRQPPAALGG